MIKGYMIEGEFFKEGIVVKDFDYIKDSLKKNECLLSSLPVEVIVSFIDKYSKKLSSNRELLKIEGVPFLSYYFKRGNIEKLIKLNLGSKEYLDKFVLKDNEKFIKAQRRGIICHWVAANVPTLSMYSLFQSIICKNSNIVRVPKDSIDLVLKLLKAFDNIEVEYNDKRYSTKSILKNISIIYFDSSNKQLNHKMSKISDCRIMWGGKKAIDSITSLPKRTTCKDLVFGPKYSFAVFDKTAIESCDLDRYLENLVQDVIIFDQKACSSPQVLFLEKSDISIEFIAAKMEKIFNKLNKRYPKNNIEQYIAAKTINKRGEYALSLDKNFYSSKGLDYTIFIDKDLKLEEPIQGRSIFLKEITNIFEVVDLITPKIQTIGVASKDKEKIIDFTDEVTKRGVDRVVKVGYMNFYDSPWDGSLVLSELVRWCSLNINGMI